MTTGAVPSPVAGLVLLGAWTAVLAGLFAAMSRMGADQLMACRLEVMGYADNREIREAVAAWIDARLQELAAPVEGAPVENTPGGEAHGTDRNKGQ